MQACLWGQGPVPGVGEGIQLQRQDLDVTAVSSQMANSARVLSFPRCHFLWGQGRGEGNPTKGWLHKLSLSRAREILRAGRADSGFCQTIYSNRSKDPDSLTALVRPSQLFSSHPRDTARLGTPGQCLFSPAPVHLNGSHYPTFCRL